MAPSRIACDDVGDAPWAVTTITRGRRSPPLGVAGEPPCRPGRASGGRAGPGRPVPLQATRAVSPSPAVDRLVVVRLQGGAEDEPDVGLVLDDQDSLGSSFPFTFRVADPTWGRVATRGGRPATHWGGRVFGPVVIRHAWVARVDGHVAAAEGESLVVARHVVLGRLVVAVGLQGGLVLAVRGVVLVAAARAGRPSGCGPRPSRASAPIACLRKTSASSNQRWFSARLARDRLAANCEAAVTGSGACGGRAGSGSTGVPREHLGDDPRRRSGVSGLDRKSMAPSFIACDGVGDAAVRRDDDDRDVVARVAEPLGAPPCRPSRASGGRAGRGRPASSPARSGRPRRPRPSAIV